MVLLANPGYPLNLSTSILSLSQNFNIYTKNGVFRTNKLFMISAFPILQRFSSDALIRYECMDIFAPFSTVQEISEAFDNMIETGNMKLMASILELEANSNKILIVDENRANISEEESNIETEFSIEDFIEDLRQVKEPDESANNDKSNNIVANQKNEPIQKKKRKTRSDKVIHVCKECDNKVFRCLFNYKKHVRRMHAVEVDCYRCNRHFQSKALLKEHSKVCLYRCEKCNFVTDGITFYEAHYRTHRKDESTPLLTVTYK